MKIIIYVLSLFLLGGFISAQTVSGTVFDEKEKPIEGVNIYVENTFFGATSPHSGSFSFEIGNMNFPIQLVVESTGYISQKLTLENADQPINIYLEREVKEKIIDEIVVTSSSFKSGDAAHSTVFSSMDIYSNPNALGDIVRAMQNIPGVQNIPEDGRLYIRGGSSDESKIFLDGLQVLSPYTATADNNPVRSRFSPDLFRGISLSTGGFSSEYGQAMSGALMLDSKKLQQYENKTDLNITSVGVWGGYTKKRDTSVFYISGNFTNLLFYHWIFPDRTDWNRSYQQLSSEMYYQQTVKKGILKFFGSFANYNFSLNQELPDYPILRRDFSVNDVYTSATLDYDLGNRYKLYAGVNYGYSEQDIKGASVPLDEMREDKNLSHSKIKITKRLGVSLEMKLGGELIYQTYNQKYQTGREEFRPKLTHALSVAFSELNWALSNKIGLSGGLRFENSSLLNKNSLSPRVSINYKLAEHQQISAFLGKYFQSPENEVLKYNRDLDFSFADSYILSYSYTTQRVNLRAEVYYKKYHDLITYTSSDFNPHYVENISNSGFGYAKGIDLFLKLRVSNFRYWLSYSYIDSERKFRDYPIEAQPSFVANHTASFTGSYWFNALKMQLGLSSNYSSGRPYNNPNLSGFNQSKVKNYFNTSASIAYLLKENIIIYTNLSNVFGIQQVYGYQYSSQPDEQGTYREQKITPSADRIFFLGIMMTFSNKKLNQLDKL